MVYCITEEVTRLLNDRGGLVAGICNGFQALIKLGLLPYGEIAAQVILRGGNGVLYNIY